MLSCRPCGYVFRHSSTIDSDSTHSIIGARRGAWQTRCGGGDGGGQASLVPVVVYVIETECCN